MSKERISVVVAIYNEADSLEEPFSRIDTSLKGYTYEVVVIDDHSADDSYTITKRLAKKYPIVLHYKQGERGKAYSLLEGFATAKYEVIAMIDGDLQYPPEAIPAMVEQISNDESDVVVANRRDSETHILRKAATGIYKTVFGRWLWGFDVDIQSGLKVFRNDLLSRLTLNPTSGWAFDLEFLIQARDAGQRITSEDIIFAKREAGETKINLISDSAKIASSAIKLRATSSRIIKFDDKMMQEKGSGFHYKGDEYVPHNNLHHHDIALMQTLPKQKLAVIAVMLVIATCLFINWQTTLVVLIALMTALYFTDLLFNLNLVLRSLGKKPEIHVSEKELKSIPANEYPTYTVLCPLYREAAVLPQFVEAMTAIDYDPKKLQVMLLLEENDDETLMAAKQMNMPSYIETVIVPHSMPKTKPKACNYGLLKARGDFVVIYDAEDVPDPLQLKKAYAGFKRSPDNVVCIQSKLNFYNPHQNVLTRAFTAEYSLWFDLILTGMQHMNTPIPLGGTSNHFKTSVLRELGGWDAFNVTEDADLGMRIAQNGYVTQVLDSTTMEEANSNLKNWFWQRSRWVKGYIQTFFVHSRSLKKFRTNNNRRLMGFYFQLIIGGKVLSMLINPIMWLLTIIYFAFEPVVGPTYQTLFPMPVLYLGVISMIFGNFLYMYYYMLGCARREHYELIKYALLIPFYWLAMSAAAYYAFVEFLYKPHHWRKTKHGLHLKQEQHDKIAGASA